MKFSESMENLFSSEYFLLLSAPSCHIVNEDVIISVSTLCNFCIKFYIWCVRVCGCGGVGAVAPGIGSLENGNVFMSICVLLV